MIGAGSAMTEPTIQGMDRAVVFWLFGSGLEPAGDTEGGFLCLGARDKGFTTAANFGSVHGARPTFCLVNYWAE